jgi:hypothetical protein
VAEGEDLVEFFDIEPNQDVGVSRAVIAYPSDPPAQSAQPPRGRSRLILAVALLVVFGAVIGLNQVRRRPAVQAAVSSPPPAPLVGSDQTGPSAPELNPVYGPLTLPVRFHAPSRLVSDGDVAWGASSGGDIVRIERGTVTASLELAKPVTAIALSSNGAALFVAAAYQHGVSEITELDAESLIVLGHASYRNPITALAIYGDTMWMSSTDAVYELDLETGASRQRIGLGKTVTDVARLTFDEPSARLLGLVSSRSGSSLISLDVVAGVVTGTLAVTRGASFALTDADVWSLHPPIGGAKPYLQRSNPDSLVVDARIPWPNGAVSLDSGRRVWWTYQSARTVLSCRSSGTGAVVGTVVLSDVGPSLTALPLVVAVARGLYVVTPGRVLFEPIPPGCAR